MAERGGGFGIKFLRELLNRDVAECVIWPLHRRWNGYGSIGYLGKIYYAHRFMCELAHGQAPEGFEAAHSCGKGGDGCVNPKHLSWKSTSENQLDRRKHGTADRKGGWSNKGIVTPEQIAQARALKGKKNQREIAAMLGISYQHVSLIQRGKLIRQQRA